jgi:hypothetical protein
MPFRKHWKWILMIVLLVALNLFSRDSERVESIYAQGIYPKVSSVFQFLFGWLPFSAGDIFYSLLIIFLIVSLFRFIKAFNKSEQKWQSLLMALQKLAMGICWFWIFFQLAWGLNYDRPSIPKRYAMDRSPVRSTEIDSFAVRMLAGVILYAPHRGSDSLLLSKALQVKGSHGVKPSFFGVVGNYMGYSGYFNPLTGEAQINTHMPAFTLPFTAAHESAHQDGEARESDANFIGFLKAMASQDSTLLYSAHLEMFLYANGAIRQEDSTRAKYLFTKLPPVAQKDIKAYRAFLKKYQGPIDEATTWFYTRFLQFNNQPEGMRSYDKGMVYVMRWRNLN